MRNKAQTAMEYLMTYGWAILIIIVVVAALYAMGIFTTPGGTIPCSPCFGYFAYEVHDTATNNLYLTNGAREVTITAPCAGGPYTAGDSITCVTLCGGTYPCDVTISYDVTTSGGATVSLTDDATLH